MGQRVSERSKLKLISGGAAKASIKSVCKKKKDVSKILHQFLSLDPKPGDLALSRLKKW